LWNTLAATAQSRGTCDLIVAAGITFEKSPPAIDEVLAASRGTPVLFEIEAGRRFASWILVHHHDGRSVETILRKGQIVCTSNQATEMSRLASVIASRKGVIDFVDTDLRLVLFICGENNLLQPDSGPSAFRVGPSAHQGDSLEKIVGGTWAVLNPAHTPYYPQIKTKGFAKVGVVQSTKGSAGPTLKRVVEKKTFDDGTRSPVAVIHVNNVFSDPPKRAKTARFAEAVFGDSIKRVRRVHGPVTGLLDKQAIGWRSCVFEIRTGHA